MHISSKSSGFQEVLRICDQDINKYLTSNIGMSAKDSFILFKWHTNEKFRDEKKKSEKVPKIDHFFSEIFIKT